MLYCFHSLKTSNGYSNALVWGHDSNFFPQYSGYIGFFVSSLLLVAGRVNIKICNDLWLIKYVEARTSGNSAWLTDMPIYID